MRFSHEQERDKHTLTLVFTVSWVGWGSEHGGVDTGWIRGRTEIIIYVIYNCVSDKIAAHLEY